MMRATLESLFEWRLVRWLAALAFMTRSAAYRLCRSRYRAISDLCWVVRVSRVDSLQRMARAHIDRLLEETRRTGRNPLPDAYLQSALSSRCAALYRQSGGGPHDLLRDLMVLKSSAADEKGVILLKYARTFEAVVALLHLPRLLERYTFVLEPCWAGYCDPALLMYIVPGQPVVVQCFTEDDHAFVEGIGSPLIPVRLGPADWVHAETFQSVPRQPKVYDLVMVANWGAHKRHATLFRALRGIDRDLRVLLVGFPWSGRTADDIRRESDAIGDERLRVEIVERLPHAELARYLAQCKVFVFLSRKEGDNKALVEAMFADVPAIVYERSIGGAGSRINPATGIFSSDENLLEKIRYMLDHHEQFRARAWALEHTGSPIATRIVDDALRRAARESGGRYERGIIEKINAPNLAYRDPSARSTFQADYDYILSCLRRPPVT